MKIPKLQTPIESDLGKLRLNRTLHGRSKYRVGNVTGHNVIKGYRQPGKGDAVDIFCAAGTPVMATHDGTITRIAEPDGRLGAVYIEGLVVGISVVSVFGHLHVKEGLTVRDYVKAGQVIGYVNRLLADPHLHYECWVSGKAISGQKPSQLLARLLKMIQR